MTLLKHAQKYQKYPAYRAIRALSAASAACGPPVLSGSTRALRERARPPIARGPPARSRTALEMYTPRERTCSVPGRTRARAAKATYEAEIARARVSAICKNTVSLARSEIREPEMQIHAEAKAGRHACEGGSRWWTRSQMRAVIKGL
eukprot:2431000-Pleurochrysis_carterae.AAC.1